VSLDNATFRFVRVGGDVALAEKHRGDNATLDKDIQISLEQLRNIEKKVAFDPTVLIDLEDYDAMCA
jgi:hypothetical protein